MKIKMVLMVGLLLFSCSGAQTNKDPFYVWVRDSCKDKQPCQIRLKDYTDFEWDRVYAFAPHVMEYEIEEVLGVPTSRSGKYAYEFVFLKGGKIVRHFESPIDVDREYKGAIFLDDLGNSEKYKAYNASVEFDVVRQNETVGVNFMLTCKNCD